MKYKDNMTDEEVGSLLAWIYMKEEAYEDQGGEPFDENDLEDWTDKERRAMLP